MKRAIENGNHPPMSATRVSGGRLIRVPSINLYSKREGPRKEHPAEPIDGERLVREVRAIHMPRRSGRLRPGETIRFRPRR